MTETQSKTKHNQSRRDAENKMRKKGDRRKMVEVGAVQEREGRKRKQVRIKQPQRKTKTRPE